MPLGGDKGVNAVRDGCGNLQLYSKILQRLMANGFIGIYPCPTQHSTPRNYSNSQTVVCHSFVKQTKKTKQYPPLQNRTTQFRIFIKKTEPRGQDVDQKSDLISRGGRTNSVRRSVETNERGESPPLMPLGVALNYLETPQREPERKRIHLIVELPRSGRKRPR
ncbi:hypothetical protein CDAR_481891 [Caerostris darwini]|uniref:Uncharacterized protein n=1 Tax=Caerostris darwini TaxID=1538125 RepID=A0AAV4VUG0_9ARAC|nr:hypothetical protein CDAR_481891 [Caerostris darwini]